MSEENDFEKELSQEDAIYYFLLALPKENYDKLVSRCHIARQKKEERKQLEQQEIKRQKKIDTILWNIILIPAIIIIIIKIISLFFNF